MKAIFNTIWNGPWWLSVICIVVIAIVLFVGSATIAGIREAKNNKTKK